MGVITATCILFLYYKQDARLVLAGLISLVLSVAINGIPYAIFK